MSIPASEATHTSRFHNGIIGGRHIKPDQLDGRHLLAAWNGEVNRSSQRQQQQHHQANCSALSSPSTTHTINRVYKVEALM